MATNRGAQAIAEHERALSLDRNLALAHAAIGWAKYFMGFGAEVEAHLNEAFRLSPRDIRAYDWMLLLGFTKLQLHADTEAACWFNRSIEANRNHSIAHFGLAAALALLGSQDQARDAANRGLAINPRFTVRLYREGASSDNPIYLAKRERIYEGMRLAGVPEG
jgi:tetratricopeptide (TPR) repeat protein